MLSLWKIIAVGLFVFSSLLLFAGEASAQKKSTGQLGMPMGGQPLKPAQKAAPSKETYYIVDVSHEYQIVAKSGMADLKKRLKDEYKNALKAYQLAKKDKNNKEKPEKPEEKTIKTVKSGIKTQEKAQEEMQKLVEEREKNNKKGRG